MKPWRLWCCLGLLLSWSGNSQAFIASGSIVHDPGVAQLQILQNIESVKQTINDGVMLANQAEQIKHQLQGLVYQAQNLQANPLKLLDQITAAWNQYNGLLQTVDGLGYSVTQSVGRFDQQYAGLVGTALGGEVAKIVQASQEWLGQIRQASKQAVTTQSIYDQLCELARQNGLALQAAQSAVGNLQIQQAQAQQQALTNQQLAVLAEMQATLGRVQVTTAMKQVQEEEAGRASQDYWMASYGTQGFHGVKAGKGIDLP